MSPAQFVDMHTRAETPIAAQQQQIARQAYLYYICKPGTREVRLTGFVSASSRREARRLLRQQGLRA